MKREFIAVMLLWSCSGAQVVDGQKAGVSATARNELGNSVTSDAGSQPPAEGASANSNPNAPDNKAAVTNISPDQSKALTSGPDANEMADVPVHIEGSYLYCGQLYALNTTVEVGCRFNDAKGKKVAPKSIAQTITYKAILPAIDDLVLQTLSPTHADRVYDVLFQFTAPTLERAQAATRKTRIAIHLEAPVVAGTPTDYESSLAPAPIPTNPTALTSNFTISSVSAPAGPGETTPPAVTTIKDLISGESYYRRPAGSFNWTNANLACANSDDGGFTDWRMPSRSEIEVAFAHGLIQNVTAVSNLRLKTESEIWVSTSAAGGNADFYDSLLGNTNPAQFQAASSATLLDAPLCQR